MNYIIDDRNILFTEKGEVVGEIFYNIDDCKVATLTLLYVNQQYRGNRYSYAMLEVLCIYLLERGVETLKLDDVSDRTSTSPPNMTRSGKIYEPNLSLYTTLGCEAEEGWNSGPERICNIKNMLDIINSKKPKSTKK